MKDKIENSFGEADKIFAGHPIEINNAIELLRECVDNSISIESLLKEIEKYLMKSGLSQEHILEQKDRVKKRFSNWI